MNLIRGMRDKLDKYVNLNDTIEITMGVDGPDVYDFCCFGVDSAKKLSDDRYMIFYNQISSPYNEIIYSGSDSSALFTIKLSDLPTNIQKLVFTVSIDGNSTMRNISSHSLSLKQSGREVLSLSLNGNDFEQEKAIISVEIYKKDVWRINAVARGFNGGLGDLLRAYGGEEITSESQSSPSVQTKSSEDLYNQAADYGDEKVSDNSVVIIEYDADNLSTKITVNGQPFDTSIIDGREIEDWLYPFQIRKVKWNGIFEELSAVVGSENFNIQFIGSENLLSVLKEEFPETVKIAIKTFENKEEYVEEMTKSELAEDLYNKATKLENEVVYERFFDFYKQSADLDYVKAQFKTGECYYYGNGVEKNNKKALEYFQKAANNGNTDAMFMLGVCYYNGELLEKSFAQAISWYRKASDKGNAAAQYNLAMCYLKGEGVNQDEYLAFSLLKMAAEGANNIFGTIILDYDEDTQERLDSLSGDTDAEDYDNFNNDNESSLEVDCPEPMNTRYDINEHEDYNDEDYITSDTDLLCMCVALISPDSLEEINNFFKKYSSAQINNYEELDNLLNEFYNLKFYMIDEDDEISKDIVLDFVSTLKNGLKYGENIVSKTLNWFNKDVLNKIVKKNEDKFKNVKSYIASVCPKLDALAIELKEDFNANYDKIFTFFEETDKNSLEDHYIILDALYYYLDLADNENDREMKEIESQDKKTSTAATVGGAVAGGLLSFIPFVGIPLAIGAGAIGGGLSADNTHKKYENSFRKYLQKVNTFLYHFVVMYILWNACDEFLAHIKNEADEKAGLGAIDFDESDDFFDEI